MLNNESILLLNFVLIQPRTSCLNVMIIFKPCDFDELVMNEVSGNIGFHRECQAVFSALAKADEGCAGKFCRSGRRRSGGGRGR